VLCTDADPPDVIEAVATLALGTVVSITIAFDPAMLFTPVGIVVDVIALPAVSATVPIVNELTVKSAEVCPDDTV